MTAADRIALRLDEATRIRNIADRQGDSFALDLDRRIEAFEVCLADCAAAAAEEPDPQEVEEDTEDFIARLRRLTEASAAARAEAEAFAPPVTVAPPSPAPAAAAPQPFPLHVPIVEAPSAAAQPDVGLHRAEPLATPEPEPVVVSGGQRFALHIAPLAAPTPEPARKESPIESGDPQTAEPDASTPAPEPCPAIPPDALRGQLTEDRARALLRLWPDRTQSLAAIHRALNTLPGPAIPHDTGIYRLVERLGLPTKRSEAYGSAATPEPKADAAAPDPAPAEPVTLEPEPAEPAPVAAPASPIATLDDDERATAREIIIEKDLGARALARELGIALPQAQEIAAALRAEHAGRAA